MTRRVSSARANGSLGGRQGSRNLTEEQRELRARIAGTALLDTYGRDYYSFLGSRSRIPTKKATDEKPKLSTAARRMAAMSGM